VQADNGVVHVIDRVLLPLLDSIYQVTTLFDDYSILNKLVIAAGLQDELSSTSSGGPWTVLAPNNYAFEKLMDEILIDIDDLINLPILAEVIWYHAIGSWYYVPDFDTKCYTTQKADGQQVCIDMDNYIARTGFEVDGVKVSDAQHDMSNMIIGNVETRNGVVHVVDRVLIPLFSSIVQIATSFDDYTILVQLVNTAGLTQTLINDGPFTVFAPNNNAFYILMDQLHIELDDLIKLPTLKDVLLYHLQSGYKLAKDLPSGDYTTLKPDGQSVYVDSDDYAGSTNGFAVTGISVTDNQHDTAKVLFGNVEAKNGVVHVIDRILIPVFDSIVQVATSFDDYSILVTLVQAAGLVDTLINDGPFTVFAPNNDAFYALMKELDIELEDLINLPILKEVLFYHILNGYYLAPDLPSGSVKTVNGLPINIDKSGYNGETGFAVNGIKITDNQADTANVFIGNVEARNGVVYVIDQVLIPVFQSVYDVATSFEDYTILVRLVHEAGIQDELQGPGPFTVFAPNNDAFGKLLTELDITLDDVINLPILKDVLYYHLLPQRSLITELPTDDYLTYHSQKRSLFVNTDDYCCDGSGYDISGVWTRDNQHRSADGLIGNVKAENGVVHVIDRVMVPLFEDIIQIATSFDDYTILVRLVQEAGLIDALTGPGPFTVFAPTNDAFAILMGELNIGADELLAIPLLPEIILYHCVGDFILTPQLQQMDFVTTLKADAQQLELSYYEDDPTLRVVDGQGDVAAVGLSNVRAKNGVVHVIDRVLVPLFDTIIQIAQQFEMFDILVTAVDEAGLTPTLQGPGPFTVFAPTNNAFNTLIFVLQINVDDVLNMPLLDEVILYHVVSGYLLTDDIVAASGSSLTSMTSDNQEIFVNASKYSELDDSGIFLKDQQELVREIVLSQVKAKNGVAYVIDFAPLVLLFDTVVQIAEQFPSQYSILLQCLEQTGLYATLQGPGPFTVFAPNNDAFNNLLVQLGYNLNDLLNDPNLKDILLYHVVPQYLKTDDLVRMNGVDLQTMNSGNTVRVDVRNNEILLIQDIYLIDHDPVDNEALVNQFNRNLHASNGIVHVIDKVLLPELARRRLLKRF